MDSRILFKPQYADSRALIIGIDDYEHTSLSYAVNDASGVRDVLSSKFGFAIDRITFLSNSDATANNVRDAFLSFSDDDIDVDERILVFFAGHGRTKTGYRGDVGYLVAHDSTDNISTCIRWDEFTKNSELIRAKHILFLMDSCYSGLALTRGGANRVARASLRI